jgi:hypothetical protein
MQDQAQGERPMNAAASHRRLFQPESRIATVAWGLADFLLFALWWTMTLAPLVLFLGTILYCILG